MIRETSTLPTWNAGACTTAVAFGSSLNPLAVDAHWRRLGQAWQPQGAGDGFRPGWASLTWSPAGLFYRAVFLGTAPANRARRLNERTWELGDVCEVFVQLESSADYLEIHVTPENQRLQLLWPNGKVEEFRSGSIPLGEFTALNPAWVQSAAHVGPGYWGAELLFLPGASVSRSWTKPKRSPPRFAVTIAVALVSQCSPQLHRFRNLHFIAAMSGSVSPSSAPQRAESGPRDQRKCL